MKMKLNILTAVLFIIVYTGCKKDESTTPSSTTTGGSAKSFENVLFDDENAFFSTEGTTTNTLDSNQAKLVPTTIDLTYTWDAGYDAPGMLDPIVRSSSVYYWSSNFRTAWSSTSEEVKWYKTTLTAQDYTNAKADQNKIGTFFADTNIVKLTTHTIWPAGSCIGGRNATTGFNSGQIFAFKRTSDSKRGLIQLVSVPTFFNAETEMNIIVEK